jgi:hypothetical protein
MIGAALAWVYSRVPYVDPSSTTMICLFTAGSSAAISTSGGCQDQPYQCRSGCLCFAARYGNDDAATARHVSGPADQPRGRGGIAAPVIGVVRADGAGAAIRVSAVVISSPTTTHHAVAKRALEVGMRSLKAGSATVTIEPAMPAAKRA